MTTLDGQQFQSKYKTMICNNW